MSHNIYKRDVRDYLGLISFIIVNFEALELHQNVIPQTHATE